jgi:hypothetical protein
MRKLLFPSLLCIVSLLFSTSLTLAQTPGTPTADPSATYVPHTANKLYSFIDDGRPCQMFKVSKPIVADFVYARVGENPSPAYGVGMFIFSNGPADFPDTPLRYYEAPSTLKDGRSIMTKFTHTQGDPYLTLTVGEKYWLCLMGQAGWYADSTDGGQPAGTYANGYALVDMMKYTSDDFGFIIYTSNLSSPETTTTPSTTTDTTTSTGAAPATPTATIVAPTALTVVDVEKDQGNALKLDWKASTTADIDGYKVFRSTDATKNFKEVGKTTKAILTFTDTGVVVGQKYYYQVRAYKTTKESASTNTANAIAVDNLAPEAPKNFTFTVSESTVYTFTWEKNIETDLNGYTLFVTELNDPTKILDTIEIGKDINSYVLNLATNTKLAPDGIYTYILVAKDGQTNVSEKAIVKGLQEVVEEEISPIAYTQDTVIEESNSSIWYIVGGGIVLLLTTIGVGTYFWLKAKKAKVIIPPTSAV